MLEAIFISGVDEIKVSGLYQWDRGQVLRITCPNLPAAFQVHFAKRKSKTSISVQAKSIDNVAVVAIPDALLQERFDLYAFLYFDEGVIGETVKTIRMPIKARVKPDDYVIDLPQEQATDAEKIVMKLMDEYIGKELDAAMSALDSAEKAEAAALLAENAAADARAAAETVGNAAADAEAAEAARVAAETANAAAQEARSAAESAADLAAQETAEDISAQMAAYLKAAQDAQAASEKARDEAQAVAGGDYASPGYVDQKAAAAESNAKTYTDQKIAAIPTPDVSGQINSHNADTSAHSDIRTAASGAKSRADAAYTLAEGKQSKITGTAGQVVGFDASGNPVAQEAPRSSTMGAASYALTASAWTEDADGLFAQTISVSGVTTAPEQVIIVDVQQTGTDTAADTEALAAWAGEEGSGPASWYVAQGSGTLTFHAKEAPTVNIPLNVGVG